MISRIWPAIGVAIILALVPRDAFACSCAMAGTPCQAAWTADVVFVGTVRSVENHEERATDAAVYRSRLVRFDVEQGFVNAAARQLEVTTGMGGGDCGYSFAPGGRYLVYAWKRPSGLSTGICSRTRPIADATEDLRYLSSLPPAGAHGRISGRVTEWRRDPAEERGVDYGPLEGLTVSLRSTGVFQETVTDINGRYELVTPSTGNVTVAVTAPLGFSARGVEQHIEIKDVRSCSALDFQITQIAQAWGAVVDAGGRPVAGVEVDAVAAELAGFDPPQYQRPVKTDDRGMFEFDDLPPGTYVFGINLTRRPYGPKQGQALFLPGSSRASEASVIELKAGDRKEVGVLRLSQR